MERTQIYLGEALKDDLRRLAAKQGRSLAALVREAAAEYVINRRDAGDDPIMRLVGIATGEEDDGSLNHDHYLYGAPKVAE